MFSNTFGNFSRVGHFCRPTLCQAHDPAKESGYTRYAASEMAKMHNSGGCFLMEIFVNPALFKILMHRLAKFKIPPKS